MKTLYILSGLMTTALFSSGCATTADTPDWRVAACEKKGILAKEACDKYHFDRVRTVNGARSENES